MDRGEEVACRFVVSGGDSSKLLEFGEEVFDQVACFIELPVVTTGLEAFGACWPIFYGR